MPIQWTISHPTRLVVAVARGDLRLADIEGYLDGIVVAGGLPYRKIFDMTQTTTPVCRRYGHDGARRENPRLH